MTKEYNYSYYLEGMIQNRNKNPKMYVDEEAMCAFLYAKFLIKDKVPEAEEFIKNHPKRDAPRQALPDPLEAVRVTSRQDLDNAQELVRRVGSLEGAIASLVALGQLRKEQEPQNEQHYGGA